MFVNDSALLGKTCQTLFQIMIVIAWWRHSVSVMNTKLLSAKRVYIMFVVLLNLFQQEPTTNIKK